MPAQRTLRGIAVGTMCGVALSVLGVTGLLEACSAFSASSDDSPAADANATVDGSDGGTGQDGGGPTTFTPGELIPIASETASVLTVAVDATSIYWWSTKDERIVKVDKTSPKSITTVITRPQQTVTDVVVDTSGVYWLEYGIDPEGGVTSRINHIVPPSTSFQTIASSATQLARLTIGTDRLGTTEPGAVDLAYKTGQANDFHRCGVALTQDVLAGDGEQFFYFYLGSIYRFKQGICSSAPVVGALDSPRALVADSSSLYAVVANGTGSALVKLDKTTDNQAASAATSLAPLENGAARLAVDNLGILVANIETGTISRVDRIAGSGPKLLQSGISGLNAIAADSDGVYWSTDTGAVMWLHR